MLVDIYTHYVATKKTCILGRPFYLITNWDLFTGAVLWYDLRNEIKLYGSWLVVWLIKTIPCVVTTII